MSFDTPIKPQPFKPSELEVSGGNWLQQHKTLMLLLGLALIVIWFLWFIFSAKSVRVLPDPADASLNISGGFNVTLGDVYLLREGNYQVLARAPGYYDLELPLTVGHDRNQEFRLELKRLPGLISFTTSPPGVTVAVDGTNIGTTPLEDQPLPAGAHQIEFHHPRYQPLGMDISVEGRQTRQSFEAELAPDWAVVSIDSVPHGALILVDPDSNTGASQSPNSQSDISPNPLPRTPGNVEILSGKHTLKLKLKGYKSWQKELNITAGVEQNLATVQLEKADGLVNIVARPGKAGVTVNGNYQGDTPLELNLKPNRSYDVRLFKPGFQVAGRTIRVESGKEQTVEVRLKPLVGRVQVQVIPEDAELYIDGKKQSQSNIELSLSAMPHSIQLKKPGYAGYATTLTPQPGFTQEVKVKLLTLAEARLASLVPSIKSTQGHTLKLIPGASFSMGASRREPGRRANETLHKVNLTRLFYLSDKEVTNTQFRRFAPGHDSGEFEEHALNKDDQPVVNVTWQEAALYCNWLSAQENLRPFYRVEYGSVVGIDPKAKGYRLPTEAEWSRAARLPKGASTPLRFPWGDRMPPPDRQGNYADMAAAHLVGRIVFGYNDNYIVSAPVGTFKPDTWGIYDLGGNVAEWVNDFYEIPPQQEVTDPLGPAEGEYHVIRGSSWMHGTITDLRLSFRDYGRDGRKDLGFRIARFAE